VYSKTWKRNEKRPWNPSIMDGQIMKTRERPRTEPVYTPPGL